MSFAPFAPVFDAPSVAWRNGAASLARWWTAASVALFAVYIAAVALAAWVQPTANWDAIAYTASALDTGERSRAEVHAQAYAAVRAEVGEGAYEALTKNDPYRVRQATDPDAFASMLPFYETKLLYVAAARALSTFVGTYDALRLLSVGSVVAIGIVCLGWLAQAGALRAAALVAGVLSVSNLGVIASNVVPDLFAAAFVLLAGWAMIARRDWLVVVAMALAVLARPDHVAFAGVLMVVAVAAGLRAVPYLAMFAAAFAAYAVASNVGDHPGWWVQFHFTNVAYTETMEGFDPAFTVATYAKALVTVAARALAREPWPFVALALFALASWLHLRARLSRREVVLTLALLLTFAAKFAIFPLHETRFHIAQIVLLATMLAAVAGRMKGRNELSP